MSLGLTIKPTIGVGDALQFSSAPENYFRATGKKIYDLSRPWFFDHNPYVIRQDDAKPNIVKEMWNFSPKQFDWPNPRGSSGPMVYLSNAEIWASVLGVEVTLNRPRLYRYEDFPFHRREMILLHTSGISHGEMPKHIVDHVLEKYSGCLVRHIGPKNSPDLGIEKIQTNTLWELAEVISKARMFIGVDSGPSWIAACYPDVILKKVRTKPSAEYFKKWVPLDIGNIHSHWDSREHQVFNTTEDDIGFTYSYRRL